jgi:signal peptidase I
VTETGEGRAAAREDVPRDAAEPGPDVAVDAHDGDGNGDGASDGDTPDAAPAPDAAARRRRALLDWIIVIGVALLVAFLVRTFVLAHFVVDGTSMSTTLHDGDRVFVNKLSYRLHDPHRGDVVVLHEINGTTDRDLIKRVIALPGETIEMRNCDVTINGRHLDEPYLDPQVVTPGNCGGDLSPTLVPKNHVFVMGDNRAGSLDSRNLGPIAEKDLVGRAFVVFWPRAHWQWL